MTALVTTGCLVTDVLEEQVAPPPAENSPPRIVESSVEPPNGEIRTITITRPETDCTVVFTVGRVEDDDLGDELEARWFVDNVAGGISKMAASNQAERIGPKFELDLSDPKKGPEPGLHVVLMVLSDGFAPGGDLREIAEGRGSVSYEWVVDTSATAVCKEQPQEAWR